MESADKYALVTGASSGIGWHFSEELARRGYSVIAISNQPDRLAALKSNLEGQYPVTVRILDTGLDRAESPETVIRFCSDNNIEPEVVVNNAGMFFFGEITTIDHERMRSMLNLHMLTPALLCRHFGRQMARKGCGYILNVSSITTVMPYPGISVYAPTKAFLRHFSRSFRTEMKLDNVNVTCLIPGATDTSLYDKGSLNISLLRKLGLLKKPEDVARSGINALFAKRAEYIPGIINKLAVFIIPVIPRFVIEYITRNTTIIRKKKDISN